MVSVALSHENGHSRLQLDGAIDISCAAELKGLLIQALASGTEICVSVEEVREMDVTAVQLLFAAECEAQRRGFGFRVTELPATVKRAIEEAGLRLPVASLQGAGS